ncbi:hypothetical protein BGW41_007311 [Actinomortierella wolfii]|nr:hypothetical protein BGW41_007311 [Actinomortierella wolfii]
MSLLARSLTRAPLRRTPLLARAGGHQEYNLPTGYLFGEKPLPAGAQRVKEDWESMYVWGFFGSMAFATALIYYKPDTNLHSWAYREAKARMEARGEATEYKPEN